MNGLAPLPVQKIMETEPAHQPVPRAPHWADGAAYVIDCFVPLADRAGRYGADRHGRRLVG